MDNNFQLRIAPDGEVVAIYNDVLSGLLSEGRARIERASAVEPSEDCTGWHATMNDGKVLGPYKLRQDALDAEVAYLNERLF